MRALLIAWVALLLALAGSHAAAQPTAGSETGSSAPAAIKPLLFAVEFRIGANWNPSLSPGQQAFMREHSANLRKLRDEGRIRFGARYGEVGLMVLEAASIDEARAWIEADPAVKAGTFRFEIQPLAIIYGGTLSR